MGQRMITWWPRSAVEEGWMPRWWMLRTAELAYWLWRVVERLCRSSTGSPVAAAEHEKTTWRSTAGNLNMTWLVRGVRDYVDMCVCRVPCTRDCGTRLLCRHCERPGTGRDLSELVVYRCQSSLRSSLSH